MQKAFVTLLSVLLLPSINWGQNPSKQASSRPYDGQTLYRALFFGVGPLVAKIPTIKAIAPYFASEYKQQQQPVIKYILTKQPAFFNQFANQIQSGDRVQIKTAIKNASEMQKEALLETTKTSNTKFALSIRQQKERARAEPDTDLAKGIDVFNPVVMYLQLMTIYSPPAKLKGLTLDRYVDEIVQVVPKTSAKEPKR